MSDKPDGTGLTVDLADRATWAAVEGIDLDFAVFAIGVATGVRNSVTYLVPAGKTLYVVSFAVAVWGNAVADREKNQICAGNMWNVTTGDNIIYIGGNGGASIIFPKPIVIPAGQRVSFDVINWSGHDCIVSADGYGYEVTN